MAWRYCGFCGAGQNLITIDELASNCWSDDAKVPCDNCGVDRDDDTPSERIRILVEEVVELRGATS